MGKCDMSVQKGKKKKKEKVKDKEKEKGGKEGRLAI